MTTTASSDPIESIPEPQAVRERLARNLQGKDVLVRLLKLSELAAESLGDATSGEASPDE